MRRLTVVVLAGCAAGVAACGGHTKGYRVPSEAMEPTLPVGSHIKVDLDAYAHARPKVGDVIVFHPPAGADVNECGAPHRVTQSCPRPRGGPSGATFVKRIVAVPGDRVHLVDGHVIRNGKPQADLYIRRCEAGDGCTFRTDVTVPAGEWFVLGDNRGASDDSRFWGPIKTAWIIGKVVGH